MKPASAKQRSTQSVNKRKREPPATVKVQDVQRTLQATTARLQHVDLGLLATPSSDVDDDTPGVLHPDVIDEPAAKRLEHETPDSSQPGSCHSSHTARSNEVHHLLSVATTQRSAYARRECGTQTLKRNSSITFCERRQWRRKEMMLQARVERLKQTVDKYKEELRLLKEECKVDSFLEVVQEADEQNQMARMILDQVLNFKKKRPTWSETTVRQCIILRNLSTKSYEYIRQEQLLKLPCRNTLQNYVGNPAGEVGFSSLVYSRLRTEVENLKTTQSRVCSLVVDEMHIRQRLEYHKQRDAFVGDVDMSAELGHLVSNYDNSLANALLCFLLCGLSVGFKIPVGDFFTKGCSGDQLATVILHIIRKVEELGLQVVRLVSDNHKVNVSAMDILCNGAGSYCMPHPVDTQRKLFLAFDQSHIIKNVRSQFLARELGGNKEISSSHIKKLYKMQAGSTVKPVRFLTRKHIYPTNIEKMNVRSAVQIFSPPVTAALSFMKDQAGHTCDVDFASVEPTVEFMKTMHRWFLLMDVSNCKQHIHLNHPDTKQFSSPCDERLDWLEIVFIEYLLELKKNSLPQNFLTKETYHALVLTTHSNVECIRYLLREKEFGFVLTRKFSSDPLEALFGFLRRTAGCNDALDMRATLNGLEKMLKTGLIASSNQSNVASSSSYQAGTLVTVSSNSAKATTSFPLIAEDKLRELCLSPRPQQPGPGAASIAMVGGFIARAISEKINCDSCIALVLKPKSSAPVDGLIAYQDRGGLCYPTSELITALTALKSFVDTALQHRKNIVKPLQTSVERAVQVMIDLPILTCRSGDREHRQLFLELLCMKFVKPLLTNYAADMTDKNTVAKLYGAKPLSRKFVKLT